MDASSGIILSDIEVLLSYLLCNVTNDSNAGWFIGMHTETRKKKKLWEATWKIAYADKLLQHSQPLYVKRITWQRK